MNQITQRRTHRGRPGSEGNVCHPVQRPYPFITTSDGTKRKTSQD